MGHDESAIALQAVLAKYAEPDRAFIGKLPRVTCSDCSNKDRVCTKHSKSKCSECKAYISSAHIHLDFVGHAEATRILIEIDPFWSWEPQAWGADGAPAMVLRGKMVEMWGRMTLLGKTLPCVGSVEAGKGDISKELIGDLIRNGAMRFGIALALWSKADKWEMTEAPEADAPPAPPKPNLIDRERFLLAAQAAHITEEQVCTLADPSRPALELYDLMGADDCALLRASFQAVKAAQLAREAEAVRAEQDKVPEGGGSSVADPAGEEQGPDAPPASGPAPTSSRRR